MLVLQYLEKQISLFDKTNSNKPIIISFLVNIMLYIIKPTVKPSETTTKEQKYIQDQLASDTNK